MRMIVAVAALVLVLVGCGSNTTPTWEFPTVAFPTVVPTALPATVGVVEELEPTATVESVMPGGTAVAVDSEGSGPGGNGLIVVLPTQAPAPEPTVTKAVPTATLVPTPRPGSTADDADICRRTPWVQDAVLEKLGAVLCAAVSPRELFRIGEMGLRDIRHPDDLSGFDNLYYLSYFGALDYVDLSHTPGLRALSVGRVDSWGSEFSFGPLPQLEELHVYVRGQAACGLLEEETLERVFGPVMGRLGNVDFRLSLEVSWFSLGEFLGMDVARLAEGRAIEMWGEDWRENIGGDPVAITNRLEQAGVSALEQTLPGLVSDSIAEALGVERSRSTPDGDWIDGAEISVGHQEAYRCMGS